MAGFYISILFLFISCNDKNDSAGYENLKLLYEYQLEIEEPSGLSKSHLPGFLFTVCDEVGRIYLISKTTGDITKVIDIEGDDIEEIVYVEKDSLLYVVEERKRWVLKLNLDGDRLDTFKLDDIPVNYLNDGPEGMTYHPGKDQFFIANQENPGRLYIYDSSFELISEYDLGFADKYSSLHYEEEGDRLWILSAGSKILARCNLKGEPEKIYYTGLPKGEGVFLDTTEQLIYIVCDITSKLYIYEMPQDALQK